MKVEIHSVGKMSKQGNEDWLFNKSLTERTKYILKNSLYCDCEFLVGCEDGCKVGCFVGFEVGCLLGCKDGIEVGIEEG